MTDAQTILSMIEAVDPADTAKLDEIDARVWCYLNGSDPDCRMIGGVPRWSYAVRSPQYTRSLDAIEDIWPKGWFILNLSEGYGSYAFDLCKTNTAIFRGELQTEALTRLYAVIQAIDYERSTPATTQEN